MATRRRKVTKKKVRPAKKPARGAGKKTTKPAPRRSVAKVDPDATIQVPVAEVLGDIEETMALDQLREEG